MEGNDAILVCVVDGEEDLSIADNEGVLTGRATSAGRAGRVACDHIAVLAIREPG
jgi:hypothetical protein